MKPSLARLLFLVLLPPMAASQEPLPPVEGTQSLSALQASVRQDTTRPPADFIPVDREPVVISKKEPVYPEAAIKQKLEGKVWVKIWVDREGMPHDVQVLKSDAEVFNQSAVEAARAFRFTPAYLNGKPVDVWVSVPFKFALAPGGTPEEYPASYRRIMDFVRDVLQGKPVSLEKAKGMVHPEAYVVLRDEYRSLLEVLSEERKGRHVLEQAGRKVTFSSFVMTESGDASYIVIKTELQKKRPRPHFHTVVLFLDSSGEWKIRHWHSW
jgi:TonB family protein